MNPVPPVHFDGGVTYFKGLGSYAVGACGVVLSTESKTTKEFDDVTCLSCRARVKRA